MLFPQCLQLPPAGLGLPLPGIHLPSNRLPLRLQLPPHRLQLLLQIGHLFTVTGLGDKWISLCIEGNRSTNIVNNTIAGKWSNIKRAPDISSSR